MLTLLIFNDVPNGSGSYKRTDHFLINITLFIGKSTASTALTRPMCILPKVAVHIFGVTCGQISEGETQLLQRDCPYPGVFRLQVVRHNPKTSCYVRTGSLRDKRLPHKA